MKNFKPIGDKIVVQLITAKERKLDSGIVVMESADKDKPKLAKVIELGDGGPINPINGEATRYRVKAGDHVFLGRYAGQEIELGNENYLIITQEDILGIVS